MIKILIGVMLRGVYISIGACRSKVGGGPELYHADQKSICRAARRIAEYSRKAMHREALLCKALHCAAILRTAILRKQTFDRHEPRRSNVSGVDIFLVLINS